MPAGLCLQKPAPDLFPVPGLPDKLCCAAKPLGKRLKGLASAAPRLPEKFLHLPAELVLLLCSEVCPEVTNLPGLVIVVRMVGISNLLLAILRLDSIDLDTFYTHGMAGVSNILLSISQLESIDLETCLYSWHGWIQEHFWSILRLSSID